MRPRLVFATRNCGKVAELRLLLDGLDVEILSLDDVEVPEVDETGDTFEANAVKKAREVSEHVGLPALADDSGLEVDALDGAPGVHSARYAGAHGDDEANNDRLLADLENVPDDRRSARFRSVLAFVDGDEVLTSEGACEGVVLRERRGTGGFGYDPLFYVEQLGATFAELGVGTKNDLSHRAVAMKAMKPLLIRYFQLANPSANR